MEKARQEADAGNYKAAVKTLWKLNEAVLAGDDLPLATQVLELASVIQERSEGRPREEAAILAGYARAVVDRTARAEGTLLCLSACRYLAGGGHDLELSAGDVCDLIFKADEILLSLASGRIAAYEWVGLSLDIEGAGRVRSGGGFIGGGFGLQGAAAGMLVAGALNALTTTTGIETIVHMQTPSVEIFLLYDKEAPATLRQTMSPVFVRLRQSAAEIPKSSGSDEHVVDRLHKLADLHDRGAITDDEYALLKANLLSDLA